MKVYTADEHSEQVVHIRLWGFDVTKRATKVAIWPDASECGLGYVDLVPVNEEGYPISDETQRYYGPVAIKFKEAKQ